LTIPVIGVFTNRWQNPFMPISSIRRFLACLAVALAMAETARAQTQVYVLAPGTPGCFPSSVVDSCRSPVVQLINTVTGHSLARFEVGSSSDIVTSLRLSSDGGQLFVTSSSSSSGLTIIDTLTRLVVARVPVSAGDVAILPDNSRAYVVTGQSSVSVVDLASFTVVATIAVQSGPRRIVASPDGNSLYVTNSGSGTVSKISAASNTVAAHITVGPNPDGLDISPDGSRLFVANSGSNTVSVIDTGNDSVLRVLATSGGGVSGMDVSAQSATRVYVSPALGPLQLLNAADGAVIGSASVRGLGRLTRDSSGTPTFLLEGDLKLVAADGTSVTTVASGSWTAAAVVTDPCAFEATATATVFGPSGGSGILTMPAPPGCPWTIDPSSFGGFSLTAPLSGTGSGTRAYTVPATSIPMLGTVNIRRQGIAFEQTVPRMTVELASGGPVRQEPFTITGWAIDQNAFNGPRGSPSTGVDQLHVWAYPAAGGAPILVDVLRSYPAYGAARPDIAAIYGEKYFFSGFTLVVRNLPSGTYTLALFAYSTRSNTFSNVQTVDVTVREAAVLIAIDRPAAGVVQGPSFTVAGWAVDTAAATGPGVDVVHVWAYPASGAGPVFLGQAAYGGSRPDVAAYLGSSFTDCGYGLTASLPAGDYTLVVFARSVATKQFKSQTVRITVQ
jgi:YVTN family beta-propeller protein